MKKSKCMLWILIFCYLPFGLYSQTPPTLTTWDTFFSYSSDEMQAIRPLSISNEELNQQICEALDSWLDELPEKSLPDGLVTRLVAYLYVAQRDFALLSHQIAQQWVGNIDLLTLKIIQLINPEFRPSLVIQVDPYSTKISEIVFRKIEERFKQEQTQLKDYPPKSGPNDWKDEPPYIGQRIGVCKLWLLPSLKDVQVAPPPNFDSLIWTFGINQILFDQEHLTPAMRQNVLYWGGRTDQNQGTGLQ